MTQNPRSRLAEEELAQTPQSDELGKEDSLLRDGSTGNTIEPVAFVAKTARLTSHAKKFPPQLI